MNIYKQVLDKLDELPAKIRSTKFNDFWDSLDREERVVFLFEALTYFKEVGQYDDFIEGVRAKKNNLKVEQEKDR